MLCDDLLRQSGPGAFLVDIINPRSGARGRPVINENVRFCLESLEEAAQSMEVRDFAARIRAAG